MQRTCEPFWCIRVGIPVEPRAIAMGYAANSNMRAIAGMGITLR